MSKFSFPQMFQFSSFQEALNASNILPTGIIIGRVHLLWVLLNLRKGTCAYISWDYTCQKTPSVLTIRWWIAIQNLYTQLCYYLKAARQGFLGVCDVDSPFCDIIPTSKWIKADCSSVIVQSSIFFWQRQTAIHIQAFEKLIVITTNSHTFKDGAL